MICIICKGEIDQQYNNKGVMYWDQGHNAQPVADGQCCNRCNEDIVIPMRMTDMKMTMYGNLYEEDK